MSKNREDALGRGASSDREIMTTRFFYATKQQLFKAFSDPIHLSRWWGPNGFTNTFHRFEMKPDGLWHFTMHGPDGKGYENKSVFVEIEEPERLVLRHLEPNHEFLLTITFNEKGDGTLLTWHMLFESADECEKVGRFVAEANEQNLDRLEGEVVNI
ncbi:SRPBCC family protein [Halobacillus sp. B23F22_1]|uniref:SRPBCC family protein n=1 Tax=Halobacillus sp. B23F22_1 TaxID=3459514 RepID=UPI00373EC147